MTLSEILFQWTGRKGSWLASDDEIDAILTIAEAETSNDGKLWKLFGMTFRAHTDAIKHLEERQHAASLIDRSHETHSTKRTPPPPVPLAQLPPLLRDVITAADRELNIPPEMTLLTALCMMAMATQGRYDVDQGKYGILTLSQYGLAIQESGGGKTTIFNKLIAGVRRAEDEDQKIRAVEEQAYTIAKKRYDMKTAELTKEELTQDELIRRLNVMPKPKPVMSHKKVLTTITTNGVIKQLTDKPALGIFDSDAGAFLDSYSFNNQGNQFIATLTSLWSGDTVGKATGIESLYVRRRRLSLLLMVQPRIGNKFLAHPQHGTQGQGLGNRLLTVAPQRRPRRKNLTEISDARQAMRDNYIFEQFSQRLYDQFRMPVTVNDDLELTTKRIGWDGEGRPDKDSPSWVAISAWGDGLIDQLTTTYKGIYNYAIRAHEFAFKLAASIAVFDHRESITMADAESGIALAQFFLDERLRIEDQIHPDTKDHDLYELAIDVVEKLQTWSRRQGIMRWTERNLRNGIRPLQPAGASTKILGEMEAQGWVICHKVGKHGNRDKIEVELTKEGARFSKL